MHSSKKIDIKTVALIGVLAALVFALSMIELRIPLPGGDQTRIHFGNIMCLTAGVLFGPMVGGLAAGLGSMFYDFTNPAYAPEFWITFITKFAMGAVAGLLAHGVLPRWRMVPRVLVAGLCGQFTYIVLYVIKTFIMQHYVYGNPLEAALVVVAAKAGVSATNGIIAVVGCVVLVPPLSAALASAGLFQGKKPMDAGT